MKINAKDKIERLKSVHLEKVIKLETLQLGLDWFMSHFDEVVFNHSDVRGGDVTPSVILATKDVFDVDQNALRKSFLKCPHYTQFKKYKLTFGTLHDSSSKRYFYVQCNDDLKRLDVTEQKQVLKNRMNSELFPHVEEYYV